MEPHQPGETSYQGSRVTSDFLERKKDLIAKTNQLINGHRNAQVTNSGRSISLGSANGTTKRETSPSTADGTPSSMIRNLDEMGGGGTGQSNNRLWSLRFSPLVSQFCRLCSAHD